MQDSSRVCSDSVPEECLSLYDILWLLRLRLKRVKTRAGMLKTGLSAIFYPILVEWASECRFEVTLLFDLNSFDI